MGKAYDRVMESRKELTKQLISEMSQGELCWIKGWNSTGKVMCFVPKESVCGSESPYASVGK